MKANLGSPLPNGAVATFELADLSLAVDGTPLDPSGWVKAVDYGVSGDRSVALFTVQGGPLPVGARSIGVSLPRIYIVPPDGDGIPREGLRTAVASLDPGRVPRAGAVPVTNRVLDTGFGWRYVVDAVESDPTSARVTYHIEGDAEGIQPVPVPDPARRPNVVPLPEQGGRETLVFPRDPGQRDILLYFGAAARPVKHPASAVFERSERGWSDAVLNVDGTAVPVRVRPTVSAGRDYVSIVATSALLLNSYGSPGQIARLVDDHGRSYPLYHGSSSGIPPTESRWDFEGPIDPTATRMTMVIDGYAELESGEWSLAIPLGP
jgi:hypothetical protein